MKLEVNDGIIRGLPLAILLTLMLQGAGAVWWLSAKSRDGVFIERRVEKLESVAAHSREVGELMAERLARIEERLVAQNVLLARIEKQISRK